MRNLYNGLPCSFHSITGKLFKLTSHLTSYVNIFSSSFPAPCGAAGSGLR